MGGEGEEEDTCMSYEEEDTDDLKHGTEHSWVEKEMREHILVREHVLAPTHSPSIVGWRRR